MKEIESASLLERYQKLIDLSLDLASTLDLNELLNRIVSAAADLSHAEAASILLYDELNKQLYFQAATNMDTPMMRGLIVPVTSSIAGWIVLNHQPVIVNDAQTDPRHFGKVGQITQVQTKSLLGVPLMTQHKAIGVLEAINKQSGHFTVEDQNILMALGAQAAVAIENTRLFHQSDLISDLVHEIRTPLASLTAATHLLRRVELTEQMQDTIIETMEVEIQRLSEMTSAFLDFARLESGRMLFNYEVVNLKELILECVLITSSKIEQRNQTFEYKIADDIMPINADYDKIKQVVLNLLSNAMKYTPEGGNILLTVENVNGDVALHISDNGPGIPTESLSHIFERFYRVPGTEHLAQGTGLGLSICQSIIETHRGKIAVQSQVGKGTTFSVFLPSAR